MIQTSKLLQICFGLAIIICLSSGVFAIDLKQYRQKLSQVKESLDYLLYPDEDLSEAENIAEQREIIKKIRAALGQTERLEMKGATFEVSHNWFFEKLKEVENEPSKSAKKTTILNELFARFSALETKLDELEKQELSARTKDEEKQKLDEILKREEYQKPKPKGETWIQRKWREFWEWWRSLFPESKPVDTPEVSSGVPAISYGLQILLYAIVIGLIGFVIYRFAPFFFNRIKNREKKEKKTRVILGETLSAEDTSHNIFSEAEKLAREGNLRGAIRKGYIALLCELSDRKIIGLARHKTNRDYLRDIRNRKEIYSNVNTLTGSFERNWYGFNPTEERDWEEFRQTYRQTVGK